MRAIGRITEPRVTYHLDYIFPPTTISTHIDSDSHTATIRMRNTLISLNISVYFDDFGNGQSVGHGCTGKHDGTCMVGLLINVLPHVMAVLEQ
ncbi:unnamed protein product [Adineta steineri]|uniref:Uncharacterized protein n=1 Tax=Adineta steineri TaxID=433720 RepID=A0A814WZE8_9BILA|nr:unnamed protein product [Adineta steineri]CAF1209143.1 unnamed protein product [Adineta steineri]